MRTQHTPGPWVAEIGVRYIEIEGDDWVIAETDTYKVDAPPRPDCIANARLIAAAPELLWALQKAVARQGFSNGELLDARAAIDKAAGHNAEARRPAGSGAATS